VIVALGTQRAMRMRHIVICGLPGCTVLFPHYVINGKTKTTIIEYKICALIFSTTSFSETFLILRRVEVWSKIHIGLHVKYPFFLSDCNETRRCSENTQIS
jgi:hypothetical protein